MTEIEFAAKRRDWGATGEGKGSFADRCPALSPISVQEVLNIVARMPAGYS